MPRTAHVVAYIRVSSASQDAASQRDAIERATSARATAIEHWYEDKFTGGGRRPPALLELLEHARAGRVNELYVYRLDRLSRRGIRDTLGLIEELESSGVRIVTIADGFTLDQAGPTREVLLAVMAWASKMERLAIAERIQDARKRVEAGGGAWGRPRRMTEEQVTKAREMKAKGRTNRSIAAALGVPVATISRAVIQKSGKKWGARARAKAKLRRLRKQGKKVDLRKTRAGLSRGPDR